MAFEQKYISVSCQKPPEKVQTCSLRYWSSSSQTVANVPLTLWELRRIGDAASAIGNKYVHKWVQEAQRAGLWSKLFVLSGCVISIVSSLRSQQATGSVHPYAQEEFTIETRAMLALLCLWMNSGNNSAGLLLSTLLRKTVSEAQMDEVLAWLKDNSHWGCCPLEPQAGVCEHMFPYIVSQSFATMSVEEKYAAVVKVCGAMVFYLSVCPAAQKCWPEVSQTLCRHICGGLAAVSHSDALEDVKDDPSLTKRRKIASGVMQAVAAKAAGHNLSMGSVAVMSSVAARSTVSRFHEEAVAACLAAAWQRAGSLYVCGVSADCKRLGNPAEELCCYYLLDAETSQGTWLPFQVCSCCLVRIVELR